MEGSRDAPGACAAGRIRVLSRRTSPPSAASGVHVVDTTARAAGIYRALCPHYLGPAPVYEGIEAANLENAWQFAKLYPEHANRRGEPTFRYWQWARQGWSRERAVFAPMGRGARAIGVVWRGECLDERVAYQKIYFPLYKNLVAKTAAYARLAAYARRGDAIYLRDDQGYDAYGRGLALGDVLEASPRELGHAFILAAMLIYGPEVTREDLARNAQREVRRKGEPDQLGMEL